MPKDCLGEPEGLRDILQQFTNAVIRENPSDISEFAAQYFTRAKEKSKRFSVPLFVSLTVSESQEDLDELSEVHPMDALALAPNRFARRHSVSAESYNPEADEVNDLDERIVHPKSDAQRLRLSEAVRSILLFRSLDSEQTQGVIDAMAERQVEAGERIITQGDDGDNFYVIQDGVFHVLKSSGDEEKKVMQYDGKGSFGELALMYNEPRAATVVCVEPGTLWAMDRASFQRTVLKSAFRRRRLYEDLLENLPMLGSLDSYERMTLGDALMPRTFSAGQCIIRQGDLADGMYFIEKGSVIVMLDGHNTDIGKLEKGHYFGEVALIRNAPRTASVFACADVKLAFLERDSFERLIGPCIEVMERGMEAYHLSDMAY